LRKVGRALVMTSFLAARARGQFVGGTVVDKRSDKPISGVRVTLVDSDAKKIFTETKADTTGMFMLKAPASGVFRLAFAYGSWVLGASELFAMTDTGLVQHRYVFELSSDDAYLDYQVSNQSRRSRETLPHVIRKVCSLRESLEA
jgi:hypothetical protein